MKEFIINPRISVIQGVFLQMIQATDALIWRGVFKSVLASLWLATLGYNSAYF